MSREGEVGHVPEGGGGKFEKYPEGGTTSVSRKGETTELEYLTFDPGGLSTIDLRKLDQDSDSKKSPRCEPNKSTKSILEMSQETWPDNFQVKVP